MLRKSTVPFSQLVIYNFWSKIIFITIIKWPLNSEGSLCPPREGGQPLQPSEKPLGSLGRGLRSCQAHSAGLGATLYCLGASVEKPAEEKLSEVIFAIFKPSQNIVFSRQEHLTSERRWQEGKMGERERRVHGHPRNLILEERCCLSSLGLCCPVRHGQ